MKRTTDYGGLGDAVRAWLDSIEAPDGMYLLSLRAADTGEETDGLYVEYTAPAAP